jgi:hypothetical protein
MRDTIDMARESWIDVYGLGHDRAKFIDALKHFEFLVRADEREACLALREHEDVLAPVGASSWGEAYQEGWAQGTAAYHAAIRARGDT